MKQRNRSQEVHKKQVKKPAFKVMPTGGNNNLGVYNGLSDLETFLFRSRNCVNYFNLDDEDQLFQFKNALVDSAGYIVTEIGVNTTIQEVIDLLRLRFGNENQQERFRGEMKSRKRRPGETLQQLYRDLCRLKSLAFGQETESSFSKLFMRDVFLDAVSDRELCKQILIQKPTTMEEALKLATHIEAIDALGTPKSDIREQSRARHRVQILDQLEGESGAGVTKKGDDDFKRQLVEMRDALHNVRQELALTRQQGKFDNPLVGQQQLSTKDQSVLKPEGNTFVGARAVQGRPRYRSDATFVGTNTCRYCRNVGHWVRECPIRKEKEADRFFRHASEQNVEKSSDSEVSAKKVFGKNQSSHGKTTVLPSCARNEAHLEIRLNKKKMYALLDSGCGHSVISRRLSHELEPTKQQLFTASGASLPLIRELKLKFQAGGIWTSARVVVSEADVSNYKEVRLDYTTSIAKILFESYSFRKIQSFQPNNSRIYQCWRRCLLCIPVVFGR